LLLLEPICAVFDDVCASAHPTTVCFLYHVAYLTITYFSSTTLLPSGNILTAPEVVAGHCIVEGFLSSQPVFLQRPAARTMVELNPNNVNISVKVSVNLTK